jgi:hypothetical protein
MRGRFAIFDPPDTHGRRASSAAKTPGSLTRLYVVVAVPWVAWYGYQIFDAAQRSSYSSQRAISHAFWSLLIVPNGGPILLVMIVWVLAGFRKSVPVTNEAGPVQKVREGSLPTDPQPSHDFTGAGRGLGKIFIDLDVWRDASKLREYKAPDDVAAREMAFARVAIIRDAIKRCQPGLVATQMLAGVEKSPDPLFVFAVFLIENGLHKDINVRWSVGTATKARRAAMAGSENSSLSFRIAASASGDISIAGSSFCGPFKFRFMYLVNSFGRSFPPKVFEPSR